jgi:hypothetical protein
LSGNGRFRNKHSPIFYLLLDFLKKLKENPLGTVDKSVILATREVEIREWYFEASSPKSSQDSPQPMTRHGGAYLLSQLHREAQIQGS